MRETDYSWGPSEDSPPGDVSAAQAEAAARAEAAALRIRVAELEAEVDRLITGLCHATLHDGRGGRVGLPTLWRSWFDPTE